MLRSNGVFGLANWFAHAVAGWRRGGTLGRDRSAALVIFDRVVAGAERAW